MRRHWRHDSVPFLRWWVRVQFGALHLKITAARYPMASFGGHPSDLLGPRFSTLAAVSPPNVTVETPARYCNVTS